METAMKLAIETYSEISGESFESIVNQVLEGNEIKLKIVCDLMDYVR